MIERAIAVAAARGASQDRIAMFDVADGSIVVLADGAGGTARGAVAATAIVSAVRAIGATAHDWCQLLVDIDPALRGGQSTAVIVALGDVVRGASVGDSEAWLVTGEDIVELTADQSRKPLVGDGCFPVPLRATPFVGTLVVGSDGLFRYATRADIARLAVGPDLDAAARGLVDLVRLPTGGLQDDVTIVLCRRA